VFCNLADDFHGKTATLHTKESYKCNAFKQALEEPIKSDF